MIAFLTEMGFRGKIPENHPNMRTEFAWMTTLDAEHFNIHDYEQVKGYDAVFIIFPKSTVNLNAVGVEMTGLVDRDMSIYTKPVVEVLSANNKNVCNVQEGPSWFFNEYDIPTQINFFNQLASCKVLFAHNEYDTKFYKGLFPGIKCDVIPTLMVAPYPGEISAKQNKVIIGGNFCRWYGGFQSYMVANQFDCDIFVPASHCKRPGEEQMQNLKHLPWVMWNQWMNQLASFKYAVNMMPTIAAGTFSMNCAYYGIPCIGNKELDTQKTIFPELSVDVNDVESAVNLAKRLKEDTDFYLRMATTGRNNLINSKHFDRAKWLEHISNVIYG